MPSSPARRPSADTPPRPPPKPRNVTPRPPPKPQMPTSPRRTQSYSPRSPPGHPPNTRRHTTQMQPQPRPLRLPAAASSPSPSRRRTISTPARSGSQHVLIPVPIRAKDAESPVFVRAPSGQHVDFVFSKPKKKSLIGRLLDSVEWGGPEENKPYRYRKQSKPSASARPFYKKLLS